MDYDAWERAVPTDIQQDPIWALRIYRTALYLGDIARRDASFLGKRPELGELPAQLLRAAHSVSVNIAEGYSRLSRRDRGRYYEYALGSAREARDWYFKASEEMGAEATDARLHLLTVAIKILTVLANQCKPARDETAHAAEPQLSTSPEPPTTPPSSTSPERRVTPSYPTSPERRATPS